MLVSVVSQRLHLRPHGDASRISTQCPHGHAIFPPRFTSTDQFEDYLELLGSCIWDIHTVLV